MGAGVARMEFDWGPLVKPGVIVTILGGLASVIAWLLNWNKAREEGRTAELRAREALVNEREKQWAEKVQASMARLEERCEDNERRNAELEGKHARLLLKFNLMRNILSEVTDELGVHSPASPALARAKEHLLQTYPDFLAVDPHIPADQVAMIEELDRLDRKGRKR